MHYYIYADSKNRDNTSTGSSYFLSLTHPVKNITRVDLVSAKVPNCMYNIKNGSNCFSVNGVSFSLPPGFYSACGLAQAIYNTSNLNVDWLPDEGKFIFYSLSQFTFSSETPEMSKATGVTSGTSVAVGTTVYSNHFRYKNCFVLNSSALVDLTTNEFIFLDIEEFRTSAVVDSKTLVGSKYSSTIEKTFGIIPMDVCSGQIKTFKEETDYEMSIIFETPIPSVSRLTVRWLDKDGNTLSFNGFNNNSFVLRLHVLDRDQEEPEPKLEEELLMKKLQRVIEDSIPPPKQEKPKYWLYLLIIIVTSFIVYKFTARTTPPQLPPSNLVRTPQPPMSIHRSL